MIIILTEDTDTSTNGVMEWLSVLYDGKVKRINTEYSYSPLQSETFFDFAEEKKAQAIWYRRPRRDYFPINKIDDSSYLIPDLKEIEFAFLFSANREIEATNDYALAAWETHIKLGTSKAHLINKFEVMALAKQLKIEIPKSIITNRKHDLQKFYDNNPNGIISKMHDMFIQTHPETYTTYATYTEEISKDFIEKLPEKFFVALFQEKLIKAYEIRTFYLNGEMYSMAMFSQENESTSVDFRRYNRKKMNRRVPYKLPDEVEQKLDKMMKLLGLNTGSFDIVKTTDNRYVFLEVNPMGQYGMVSGPCNYNLHKKIAHFLTKNKTL